MLSKKAAVMEDTLIIALRILVFIAVVIGIYLIFKDSISRAFSYVFKLF